MSTPIEIVREKYGKIAERKYKIERETEKLYWQEVKTIQNNCTHPKEYIEEIVIPFDPNPGFYGSMIQDRSRIECNLCGKILKYLDDYYNNHEQRDYKL